MPSGPPSQNYPAQSPPGFPPQPGMQGPPQPSQYPSGYPSQQPQQGYPPQSPPGFQPQQDYTGGMHYPNNRPQAAPQKKLDPDNMPSRIQVMEDDRKNRSGEFRTEARGALPPLVTTQFTVQDGGNCSPRYVRSTMYSVPTTADIMKQVGVPFGLVISPLAKTIEGEMEPPEADFSQCGGPVRCARCKAYMAPFMQFVDGGRRFHCPMCKATTEVPETYFAHMDALGQRMDKYQRPELCLGSYELLVSEEYCRGSKFPNPPALIFILDVSYSNVKSGLVSLLCSRMMDILAEVTNDRLRVGFITFASSVHFYNIKSSLVKPELLEVTDVHDMFMPLLDGFLGSVEEAGPALQALMTQLPQLFQDTRQTETLLMPAIQAGLEALKANNTTGKLLVFNSSLPIYDAPGKLANREDRKMLGTDKEKTVLTPANQAYNNLGQECVNEGVSVDLFVFNNAYVDLATIGQVSRLTGGQIYKYTYFQADTDGERLIEDVRRNIGRPTAYDAVMRVRTSTGIRPTDFYGHMYMSNTTDMEFGSMDSDKAVALELKHDDKLVPEEGVIIQVAFLYTSAHGVRKVRVHNLSLNCTPTMADIYRYCELDSLMNFLAKQCAAKISEASPRALRDALINRTATILATYRKHCASPGSSLGQLILPECLKLLPLYANSLLRCDAISGGPEISLDDRSFALYCTSVMDIPTSVVYLYPHMISLHDLDPALDEMPVQERCSYEKLQPDGAYLIDNSIYMFLWVGSNLSPQWVESVFGVPSAAQIDTDRSNLPELPNALSRRVLDIVDYVKSNRPRSMRLTVVLQKDKLEVVLRQFLIEDRGYTEQQMSYVDFLCHIHKEIRNQLS
uniref:Protein transport protein Sec24C n=2 Tax=Cacopsylla melanoneura TaxID=428564 RepID=A0A8D9ENZ4_9HEMI